MPRSDSCVSHCSQWIRWTLWLLEDAAAGGRGEAAGGVGRRCS